MKRIFALVMMLCLFVLPALAETVTLDISKGQIDITSTGYKAEGAEAETAHTGAYVITGTADEHTDIITFGAGTFNVTLEGVVFDYASSKGDAIALSGGTTLNLKLSGTNKIRANDNAIYVPGNATLNIDGDGSLEVYSTRHVAIGSKNNSCGDIVINGGTISATVSDLSWGAVIGSGSYGDGGSVTINGGSVTAIHQDKYYHAAIGVGRNGYGNFSVTINGGMVTAEGAVGIGTSTDATATCTVEINGGIVKAIGKGSKSGIGIGKCDADDSATVNVRINKNAAHVLSTGKLAFRVQPIVDSALQRRNAASDPFDLAATYDNGSYFEILNSNHLTGWTNNEDDATHRHDCIIPFNRSHEYVNYECKDCGAACRHLSYKDGVCTSCGYVCTHSGGAATCIAKAECQHCGEPYGDIAPDNHSLTHTADGSVITESCILCKKDLGTATVAAQDGVFDNQLHEAVVTTTGSLASAYIPRSYVLASSEEKVDAPINAGRYTAQIEYGNVTASVDFEIAKADSSVLVDPAANTLIYTGSAQALVTAGKATGGMMAYSLDGESWSDGVPAGTDAKEYTVHYKVKGDGNHNDTVVKTVSVTISQSATVLTVGADKTDYVYGEYVVVTVTPAATGVSAYGLRRSAAPAAGTVSLWNGETRLTADVAAANGQMVTFDLSTVADGLTPGSYTLTAKYGENGNMAAQTAQVSFAVAYAETEKEAQVSGNRLENGIYTVQPTLIAPEGTKISFDNGPEAVWSDSLMLPAGDGEHTYTYSIMLADGTVAQKTVTTTVDTIPPIVDTPVILADSTTAQITVTATDEVSDVMEVWFKVNSGKGDLTIEGNGDGSYTVTGLIPGETYDFTLLVRDWAGHTTAVSFSVSAPALPTLPQTGDNSRMAFWLMMLSMAGCAMLMLRRKMYN